MKVCLLVFVLLKNVKVRLFCLLVRKDIVRVLLFLMFVKFLVLVLIFSVIRGLIFILVIYFYREFKFVLYDFEMVVVSGILVFWV